MEANWVWTMRGPDGGWREKDWALRDGEWGKNANYHRELETERKTDGENGRWRGRRVGVMGGCGGFVFTALVRVIEVWLQQYGKNDCSVVQQSPNSMEAQTRGCRCTLGPVLNAGGVVQSQRSWWWRRGKRRRRGGEVRWGEGWRRGKGRSGGTGGETAGGEGVREKMSW